MSSQMLERSTHAGAELTARKDGAVVLTHPRGAGFRVLSRMARTRAVEDDCYSPRHRLDNESDCPASATA